MYCLDLGVYFPGLRLDNFKHPMLSSQIVVLNIIMTESYNPTLDPMTLINS